MTFGDETAEQVRERRDVVKKEYGRFFDQLSAILFRTDPMGINFEDNTDEYEPEVETILPRLRTCGSEQDALRVIHEEFRKWFGDETAGPIENYREPAKEIWRAYVESGFFSTK